VTGFVALGRILDDHVGDTVALKLQRGGETIEPRLRVEDLYQITPGSYLQYGGAVLNNLSYQIARSVNRPIRGVYVADPGFVFSNAGVGRGAVITDFGGVATPDLDALQQQLGEYPNGASVGIHDYTQINPNQINSARPRLNNRWFPSGRCRRGERGVRPCETLPRPARSPNAQPVTVDSPD